MNIQIRRLAEQDAEAAVTQLMALVFEHGEGSSAERMQTLLRDARFWLFAAFAGDRPMGGLCAHVLPLRQGAHQGRRRAISGHRMPVQQLPHRRAFGDSFAGAQPAHALGCDGNRLSFMQITAQ